MRAPDPDPVAATTSDGELMNQVAAGSTDAFERLYDRYCARAFGLARSVCRDAGHTEEAVQESFLSLWRNRSKYRPERGTVASWLLCVVHYRAIDVARRNATHASRRAHEDAIHSRAAPDDLAGRVVARDESARLHSLLGRLPEAQREVISLAYYGHLTHAEIATQLALPTGTVKGRMRLGLKKLRNELEQAA